MNKPLTKIIDGITYYNNQSRAQQKNGKVLYKYGNKLFSKKVIKRIYRDRYQPIIDGKQKNITNCLIGIVRKEDEEEADNGCY